MFAFFEYSANLVHPKSALKFTYIRESTVNVTQFWIMFTFFEDRGALTPSQNYTNSYVNLRKKENREHRTNTTSLLREPGILT